jgi:hypothetical protein
MNRPGSLSPASVLGSSFLFLLIGCGFGASAPLSPQLSAGPSITGHVHGGQQPVVGSHVYLFGVRGDQNGVSSSLLGTEGGVNPLGGVAYTNSAGFGTDGSGNNYVITDSNGDFSFNGTHDYRQAAGAYLCDQNQVVYALAVGGNPGLASGTNNTALYMMADLGPCVGYDDTYLGATGITNASANVTQLENLSTGAALTTTPNGYGVSPAANPQHPRQRTIQWRGAKKLEMGVSVTVEEVAEGAFLRVGARARG